MDVALLLAGVQKFDGLFVRLIGTSPMRQKKFTAASFPFASVNRYLKNNNCPGFFSSTHPVIQGMAQTAMRGGLTGMYASLGGKACPAPINYHIYEAQKKQENRWYRADELLYGSGVPTTTSSTSQKQRNNDNDDDDDEDYYCRHQRHRRRWQWTPYAKDPDLLEREQLAMGTTVSGYDIHSLYASAGIYILFICV